MNTIATICSVGEVTLDCADVVRAGDLDRGRSPSAQGDSSMGLLDSLKIGRLGESPVNLSMFSQDKDR